MKLKRSVVVMCAVFAALLMAVPAGAASISNVLVFEDSVAGTSAIPGALTLWGGCVICTTTTDTGAFNTALAGGGWDLIIYAEQADDVYADSGPGLTTYVNGGGRLIGQTWRTGGLDGLLQASSVSENGTVITTDGNPVFAGLGSTINLSNPGWGIYTQGWHPEFGAVGIGSLSGGGAAIIVGNNGRTYLNAPLTDAYSTLSGGERLLANEIGVLSGSGSVPEPSTFVAFGLGFAVLAIRKLRR